jgi:hypothetical protein
MSMRLVFKIACLRFRSLLMHVALHLFTFEICSYSVFYANSIQLRCLFLKPSQVASLGWGRAYQGNEKNLVDAHSTLLLKFFRLFKNCKRLNS